MYSMNLVGCQLLVCQDNIIPENKSEDNCDGNYLHSLISHLFISISPLNHGIKDWFKGFA